MQREQKMRSIREHHVAEAHTLSCSSSCSTLRCADCSSSTQLTTPDTATCRQKMHTFVCVATTCLNVSLGPQEGILKITVVKTRQPTHLGCQLAHACLCVS